MDIYYMISSLMKKRKSLDPWTKGEIPGWLTCMYNRFRGILLNYYPATLPRSLHDVSPANNSREAVVVCFNSALRASGMRKNGNRRF